MSSVEMSRFSPEPTKNMPPAAPEEELPEIEKNFKINQLRESLIVVERRLSDNPNPGLKAALEAQKTRMEKEIEALTGFEGKDN